MSSLKNGTQVTVGDAETALVAANRNRRGLFLTNTGSNPVFVGEAGVTTTTGLRVSAGEQRFFQWDEVPQNALVGICGSTLSTTVIVNEIA